MPSEGCLVGYLVAVNLLFLGLAVTTLAFEVIEYRNPTKSAAFEKANQAGSLKFKGIVAIVISGLKMFMAIFGIAGAAMRSKMLLMVSAVLLIIDITFRILLIALLSVASTVMHKASSDEFRKVFPMYGQNNKDDVDALEFTRNVDEFMKDNPCCGWSQNFDENLFLNSTWHKLIKGVNSLPAKCCTSKAIEENRIEDCLNATDIRKARSDGVVHSKNCLSIIMGAALLNIYIFIATDCLIIILDIIAIYATRELSLSQSQSDSESSRSDAEESSDEY